MKTCKNLRLTIVEEAFIGNGKTREGLGCSRTGRCKKFSQQRRVFQIAKYPSHGVEGLRQVRAALPIAPAQ